MNEQKAGSANHIEWTRVILPDGTRTKGYTWNPIAGCQHGCRWQMPDGKIAECYAENVAENVASPSYPLGFEHHYWKPQLLSKPTKMKEGVGIFIGSMADVFGAWVPDEQITAVLDVCRSTPQHIYFVLTKNAPRLLKFEFPDNVWVGASSPPDFMFGKALSLEQREAMLRRTLKVLSEVKAKERWMSIEPLSHDYSAIFREYPTALTWAVIGAASDGKRKFPPSEQDLVNTLMALDVPGIPIFYKGNMRSLPYAAAHWREGFPGVPTTERLVTSPALPIIEPDPIPPAPITKVEPDYADPFDLPANAKVITLQQPYASAVMAGVKQIETRSWKTPYRGALVIHAGKAWNDDLKDKANSEPIASALRSKGLDPNALPLGMALGVVILDTVMPIENVLPSLSDTEKALGHYTDGNFAWCVSRPRLFREPLPGEGGLGLRDWSIYLAKFKDAPSPKQPDEPPPTLFIDQFVIVPGKNPALYRGRIKKLANGEAMIAFNQQGDWIPYAEVQPHPDAVTTVHTARVDSRDPDTIDITVKSASTDIGKFFAPTWDMVNGVKSGKISEAQYTTMYEELLRSRYTTSASMLSNFLWERRRVVFTCYCAAGEFCHRHLAVNVLAKIGMKFGFTVMNGGELDPPKPEAPPVQMSLFGDELPKPKSKVYA